MTCEVKVKEKKKQYNPKMEKNYNTSEKSVIVHVK